MNKKYTAENIDGLKFRLEPELLRQYNEADLMFTIMIVDVDIVNVSWVKNGKDDSSDYNMKEVLSLLNEGDWIECEK